MVRCGVGVVDCASMISEAVEEVEVPPLGAPDLCVAGVPSDSWAVRWAVPPKQPLSSAQNLRVCGCGCYLHPTLRWGAGATTECSVVGVKCTQLLSGVGIAIECSVVGAIGIRGGLRNTGAKDPRKGSTICGEPSSPGAGTCHRPRRRNSAGAKPRRSPSVLFSTIANVETARLQHGWDRPPAHMDCGPGSSLGRFADSIASLSVSRLDPGTHSLYPGVAQEPFPVALCFFNGLLTEGPAVPVAYS